MTTDQAIKKYLAGELDARAYYAELKKQVKEEMEGYRRAETAQPRPPARDNSQR